MKKPTPLCLFCGRDRRHHREDCDVWAGRSETDERPAYDEPGVDPRDIPGTLSFRRQMACEKGWDDT